MSFQNDALDVIVNLQTYESTSISEGLFAGLNIAASR